MPVQTVQHIADVSFKDHFFSAENGAPANGKITVNHNTFDVTFENGQVHAKFASGNAFSNMFRSGTLSRFTQTLKAQYDAWLDEQAQIEAAREAELALTLGYADNPDAPKVAAVVNEFKAVLEEANPPGKEKYLRSLDEIAKLASIRNTLTRNPDGADCDRIVREAGFLTHFDSNTKGLNEKAKKGYVLNMLDTVIGGFLQAAAQMTDKKTQVVDFMRNFTGACVEAKGDNVQEWLSRAAGLSKAAHSDSSHDLAYSVTAEFKEIAEDIRKPFAEAARASCEQAIRAECAEKGITDEATINGRIETKVARILMEKDDEIAPKIREELEKKGKFYLYESLVGALRPVTEIAKDETTGKWTVTTLVDNTGAPVLKPVSAFDIDRNFDKMVEMFMEDAIVMGMVENKTVVEEPVYATRDDFRAEGVLAKADEFVSGKADVAELCRLVKSELSFDLGVTDEKLQGLVKQALDDVAAAKKEGAEATKKAFDNFVVNYADGNYLDKKDDLARLVHLVARRTETLFGEDKTIDGEEKMFRARIAGVSARCAQMMANVFKDNVVFVVTLKSYIDTALDLLVTTAFKKGSSVAPQAKKILDTIMKNGVLFSDNALYDLGHRAGGRDEVILYKLCNIMKNCLKMFGNAQPRFYMKAANG